MEDESNSAIKYLWAREKIATLDDYGKVGTDVKNEVIKIGLKYHLMTQYTSFVAVDKIVRETGEVMPSGWQPGKPTLKPGPDLAGKVWKVWKPENIS